MARVCRSVVWLGLVLLSTEARALQTYPFYIPNGTDEGCINCHLRMTGGGTRNAFGNQVLAHRVGGVPDWPDLYALDADGDGFTNGEELGDPCGIWRRNGPQPMFDVATLPGDPMSKPAAHPDVDCSQFASSSSSAGSSSSSLGSASSQSSSSGGGGGCCDAVLGAPDASTARFFDVALLISFGLVLRRRR